MHCLSRAACVGEPMRTVQVKITLPDWIEHSMWSGDQRAARHKVYPFVAFSF